MYSGQCDYLINDASMAHANIKRMITTTIKAANLDLTSGGRARCVYSLYLMINRGEPSTYHTEDRSYWFSPTTLLSSPT